MLVGGLAALAPNTIWFDGEHVALNGSIEAVKTELSETIRPLPEALAGAYQKLLGVTS